LSGIYLAVTPAGHEAGEEARALQLISGYDPGPALRLELLETAEAETRPRATEILVSGANVAVRH
jgi:hypothetical protein